MRKRLLLVAPLAILGIMALVALGGAIVLQLWNWLLPPLFGWHEISFGQAIGILALCRILFGGLGRHGCHRSHYSPEARERFRQGMRRRFGMEPSTRQSQGQ